MARAMDPNSAGSQFFIMHADAPHLDGDYAAFGHVVSGMDAVDEIADTPTDLERQAPHPGGHGHRPRWWRTESFRRGGSAYSYMVLRVPAGTPDGKACASGFPAFLRDV